MKHLVLMRHAKSSWDHPGMDDFSRPLNHRGERDAPAAASRLHAFLGVDRVPILSSPACRARATAQAIAAEMACGFDPVHWDKDLYLCAAGAWLERIREWNPDGDVAITVGHNPGITQLANRLCLAGIDNIPTAGIVAIEFEATDWSGLQWGEGTLTWFDYPKLH